MCPLLLQFDFYFTFYIVGVSLGSPGNLLPPIMGLQLTHSPRPPSMHLTILFSIF